MDRKTNLNLLDTGKFRNLRCFKVIITLSVEYALNPEATWAFTANGVYN